MNNLLKECANWYRDLLVCPACLGADLNTVGSKANCVICDFKTSVDRCVDLRTNHPDPITVSFSRSQNDPPEFSLENLVTGPPEITYSGPKAMRDSREFLSLIQQEFNGGVDVLDLRCGPKDQKAPIESLGHRYVGVDYSNPVADMLVDAHAIPFRDESFDCVFSYAVLEHLANPFVAIREIERVLKPGGIYLGTVSQGEPFHESYFHMTPWGLLSLIDTTDRLQIERLWDSLDTLASLARIGRYPRVIRAIISLVEKIHRKVPILAPRKFRWPEYERNLDRLYRTGSVCFLIKKIEV